jgi:hypothetical protein
MLNRFVGKKGDPGEVNLPTLGCSPIRRTVTGINLTN